MQIWWHVASDAHMFNEPWPCNIMFSWLRFVNGSSAFPRLLGIPRFFINIQFCHSLVFFYVSIVFNLCTCKLYVASTPVNSPLYGRNDGYEHSSDFKITTALHIFMTHFVFCLHLILIMLHVFFVRTSCLRL